MLDLNKLNIYLHILYHEMLLLINHFYLNHIFLRYSTLYLKEFFILVLLPTVHHVKLLLQIFYYFQSATFLHYFNMNHHTICIHCYYLPHLSNILMQVLA